MYNINNNVTQDERTADTQTEDTEDMPFAIVYSTMWWTLGSSQNCGTSSCYTPPCMDIKLQEIN